MARYTVKVSKAPKGHVIPELLTEFAGWLRGQQHGAVGWFDALSVESIPKEFFPEHAARLRREGFAFLSLPDGSQLALVNTGDEKSPQAVVYLGSEGERLTLAHSFEEFLTIWSKGETGVNELDDEDAEEGHRALGAWLKSKKVKAPKPSSWDFQSWLDGGVSTAPASEPPPAVKRAPTATMSKLGPKARELAGLVGLRVDAPEVVKYVTKVLGKKAPGVTNERTEGASVEVPKQGIVLSYSHEVLNDAYPPIHKAAKSFVPYLTGVALDENFVEPILGVPWSATTREEIEGHLGPAHGTRALFRGDDPTDPYWTFVLDDDAQVELDVSLGGRLRVEMAVVESLSLERYTDVTTGLFVGWAALRGLLDASRFSAHAGLLAAVARKEAKGSELVKAALPGGLRVDHLKQDDALRDFAYDWFHNIGDKYITADLTKLFGKREGKRGHDEPKLDDDTWQAVAKASKIFEQRFERWL